MRLLLCLNKNETPPAECCDLVEDSMASRIVHALLPIDFFLEVNREIYDRLRNGEEVEIEIKEVI